MIQKTINFIKYNIFKMDKPHIDYPFPFAIINYTDIALQNNIKDNQNKVILKYYFNNYGNVSIKKYRYSESMKYILENYHGIPVYDKTKGEQKFPVFVEELPGEIVYTKR